MQLIKLENITVASDRQRKVLDSTEIVELATSIANIGLLHPVVIRKTDKGYILVAGERRLKAIECIWAMGNSFKYSSTAVEEGFIPCNDIGDLDPIAAFEAELEENIKRVNITWQEKSEATARLFELRKLQAQKASVPIDDSSLAKGVAAEAYPALIPASATDNLREDLILARSLQDPDVAKATSKKEALKVIKRKEEAVRSQALGEAVGRTFSAQSHSLLRGDCLEIMKTLDNGSFDVILTDPPYGINAQNFNDSGGKANATGHLYDDSFPRWYSLMSAFLPEAFRLTRPQAHLYIFCDVDNFLILRDLALNSGFRPFRTPLVWHNPSGQRAPWPQAGPHRKYQLCLYAIKGDRPVLKLASDLIVYPSDENQGWAAQKPVGLYQDFLSRSCRAGDTVLDCFAGSGTIFPAAHGLKIKATGIEQDPVAYGIAAKRLGELK